MRRPQRSRTSQASVVDEDILAQVDLEAMSSNPTPQSMEDEPSASDRRRKRGPNRGLELIRRPECIPIPLNGKHQPIGDDEPLLTRYIGLLARNCEVIPINYCDWRHVLVPIKERAWSLIKQRFLFPNPWVEKWVLGTYNASWKDWKYKLEKAFHDPNLLLDEQYEHRHSKVDLEQWKDLVAYWRSSTFKTKSARNKANRKKVKMPHTMGTKTYARMREDERDKLGHEPDKMHMFKVGHTRKKRGGTLDASVQTALTAMEIHLTQMPEKTDSITAKDIAFTKVMGEDSHGRAQTYGLGVAPPSRRNDLPAEALADAERRVEEERARRLLADEALTTLQEELRLVRQEQEQMKKEREEDRIAREEQRLQLLRFTKLMQSFEKNVGSSLSFDSESTTC